MAASEALPEILKTLLPVVTLIVGAWLADFFHKKQREREDAQRRDQERRAEELRREADRHDWFTSEHRRLFYDVSATAFAARNAIARLHWFTSDDPLHAETCCVCPRPVLGSG